MAEFPAVVSKGDQSRVVSTPVQLVQAQYEGYTLDAEGVQLPEPPQFPGDYTVSQVNAYLAEADDDEKDRVLTEERNSEKPRAGIVEGPHA